MYLPWCGNQFYLVSAMERTVSFKDNVYVIEEKPCVVEMQCFVGNRNDFIVKELVLLDIINGVTYFYFMKAPFPFKDLDKKAQRTNRWLTNNLHHIDWNEGFNSYKEVDNIMYNFGAKFNRFYTTGLEKQKWIQMYTTGLVYNVLVDKKFEWRGNSGLCISMKNREHANSGCALHRAFRLAAFLQNDGGGDNSGYKYEDAGMTMHEYYSNLRGDNTSSSNSIEDGFTTVS